MPTPKSARRRRLRRIFAAAILACLSLAGLLAAELIVRRVAPVKDSFTWPPGFFKAIDPGGFTLTRNFPPTPQRVDAADGFIGAICYTNSLGMHDPEPWDPGRPALRLLAIGCSLTEGVWHRDPQEPWPRRLQPLLNPPADLPTTPVVVMNAGVVGTNTFQQIHRARRLQPEVDADVWLLAYMGGGTGMWGRNTFGLGGQYRLQWGSLWEARKVIALQSRPAWLRRLMDHSILARWLVVKSMDLNNASHESELVHDFEEGTRLALAEFAAAAREAGVRPLVTFIEGLNTLEEIQNGTPDFVRPRVAAICAELGLEFIDPTDRLLEIFAEEHGAASVLETWHSPSLPDIVHYGEAANRAYARALAPLLHEALADPGTHPGAAPPLSTDQ